MFTTVEKIISYYTNPQDVDNRQVGGKAWNLFQLRRFGFSVPAWWVVSTESFHQIFGQLTPRIKEILDEINFEDRAQIEEASLQIKQMILQTTSPKKLLADILDVLEEECGKNELFAIRSSVVGEDSMQNSFAGLMDSYLNVTIEDIPTAIKRVWASVFSSRALVYRYKKGLPLSSFSAAVIIQKMIQSESAGVLFTHDPENRSNQLLIVAGYGLGEGVVANLVETDTYRVSKDTGEINDEIREKDFRVIHDPDVSGHNRLEVLPPQLQQKSVLQDNQIHQLRDVAVKAEKNFGCPQDIEWAFDSQGKLVILQSRPIIFTPNKNESSTNCLWDNSNIVESYPGLTLPLTFSFVRNCYENTFRDATLKFLLFKKELKPYLYIFKQMIGLLDGRIYYNLLNWYQMLSFLPGFKKHKKAWDQMIGIKHSIDFPEHRFSLLNRFYTGVLATWKLLTVKYNARRFFKRFNAVYLQFKGIDLSTANETELISYYESLGLAIEKRWYLTLYNDFCAMKYYDWLKVLCNQRELKQYTNLCNDLLVAEIGVESVAPVRTLISISEKISTNPTYSKLFNSSDYLTIWQQIQQRQEYVELKQALNAYLDKFGDRGIEELKLETPSFQDEPERLIHLTKNYYRIGSNVEVMRKREDKIRKKADNYVRQTLRNPFKRCLFYWVLHNSRVAIKNRENMRFARSRIFGIVRRLFQHVGKVFEDKGIINVAGDLHYLNLEEVFGYVRGTSVTKNLRELVAIRKSEYVKFRQHQSKERFQTCGIPYLNNFNESKSEGKDGNILKGIGCSSGTIEGNSLVVQDPSTTNPRSDHILVAKTTDPGWVFLMLSSSGIIVEKGSVLSHTAIIGRELGIPTIVGVKDATQLIPDGAKITMNGGTGEIIVLENRGSSNVC